MDVVGGCDNGGNSGHLDICDDGDSLQGESLAGSTGRGDEGRDQSESWALRRVDWVLGDVLNKRSVKWNGT